MRSAAHGGETVFAPIVQRVIVAVAFVSFVATIAALLWGARLGEPSPSARDSWSRGPIGHRAFVELARELGLDVVRLRTGEHASVRAPLVLIEPSVTAQIAGETHRLDEVISARERAGLSTIVVLPKWRAVSAARAAVVDPERPDSVVHAIFLGDERAKTARDDAAGAVVLEGELGTFRVDAPRRQSLIAPGVARPLLGRGEHALVARRGHLFVVADPDPLHNFDLHRADHAALAWALLSEAGATDTIVVDEVFHGHGIEPSLATALGRFPAIVLVVHLLLVAFAFVLAGRRRFGAPIAPQPPLGRGPREAIDVSASVLAAARAPGRLAARYVSDVLLDLAARCDRSEAHGEDEQADRIDALARARGVEPRAAALLARARRVDAEGTRAVAEPLRLARDAWSFRRRFLAATRRSARRSEFPRASAGEGRPPALASPGRRPSV